MTKPLTALVLVLAGYVAGTLAPHAAALEQPGQSIVQELRSIQRELAGIRSALEHGARR